MPVPRLEVSTTAGNVVVLLPGILGSSLVDRHNRPIWELSMKTIATGVLTGAKAIKRLRLPEGFDGEGPAPDGVRAGRLMRDLHVLPGIWSVSVGYDTLLEHLRAHHGLHEADPDDPDRIVNLVPFAYDWRLSNRYNAKLLQQRIDPILERYRTDGGHPDAKFVFICHSMGGLVARYFVDVLGGHDRTLQVITMGTPHRGSLNALEQLVNGARKGFGPLQIDLTNLARSLPSIYQLLPEYACIEPGSGGALRKTVECEIPELSKASVKAGFEFHEELRRGMELHQHQYNSHPILARTQPTWTTARIRHGRVEPLRSLNGDYQHGDGTVPRLSAAPYGVASNDPMIRYVRAKHGELPANNATLDEIDGVLTGSPIIPRAIGADIGVDVSDVIFADEPLVLIVESASEEEIEAEVTRADGTPGGDYSMLAPLGEAPADFPQSEGIQHLGTAFTDLAPGAYYVTVSEAGAPVASGVTTPIVVLDRRHTTTATN